MLDNPTDSLCESHSVMSDSLQPHGLYSPWNSPGQNTGVGGCFLLQGIFSTQDQTHVSRIAGRFFTSRATREAHKFTLSDVFFFEIQYEQYNYTFSTKLFKRWWLNGGWYFSLLRRAFKTKVWSVLRSLCSLELQNIFPPESHFYSCLAFFSSQLTTLDSITLWYIQLFQSSLLFPKPSLVLHIFLLAASDPFWKAERDKLLFSCRTYKSIFLAIWLTWWKT